MALTIEGLEGNELSKGDYSRKSIPEGRWADAWSAFKSNFGKMFLLNIAVCITLVPAVVLMYYCLSNISVMGIVFPHNPLTGFPFYPDRTGLNERVTLYTDLVFYAALIGAAAVAALGVSGAAYCVRRILLTQGELKLTSFFRGIKVGYLKTLLATTIFMVFLFATVAVYDWMNLEIATGGNRGGAITAFVFMIIAIVLLGLYCLWLFAVGTSYKLKFTTMLKNAFALFMKTPVQTILMGGFAFIPVWLLLIGGLIQTIAFFLFAVFGITFMLLSWTAYTQWVFDMVVTPQVASEEKTKTPKTAKQLAAERAEEEKNKVLELVAAGRSELIARPILPLPQEIVFAAPAATFTRADLAAAESRRAKLGAEVSAYEQAHANDPSYAEYNKLFADRDKALVTEDGKGKKGKKAKRISADNLLK